MTNTTPSDDESATESKAAPFVELDEVTCRRGGVDILREASLTVNSGVTAIIGPNGSGKSTLLRAVVGAIEPAGGRIRFHRTGPGRRIGYLPQRTRFRSSFTSRETLDFYASLVEDDPDRALERVGLEDAADRPIDGLSGGMRRLAGIAQALLGDPPLVVLDEPTSGLDPGMADRVFDIVDEIAGTDRGVLIASHDLDHLDGVADTIVVLHRGRIVDTVIVSDRSNRDESVGDIYRSRIGRPSTAVHVTGVTDR